LSASRQACPCSSSSASFAGFQGGQRPATFPWAGRGQAGGERRQAVHGAPLEKDHERHGQEARRGEYNGNAQQEAVGILNGFQLAAALTFEGFLDGRQAGAQHPGGFGRGLLGVLAAAFDRKLGGMELFLQLEVAAQGIGGVGFFDRRRRRGRCGVGRRKRMKGNGGARQAEQDYGQPAKGGLSRPAKQPAMVRCPAHVVLQVQSGGNERGCQARQPGPRPARPPGGHLAGPAVRSQAGCCWVRQCRLPKPSTRSRRGCRHRPVGKQVRQNARAPGRSGR
jgi:hypothetical protein